MTIESLKESLKKIDNLISMAKTNKAIDVKDLKKERRNCAIALKKLKRIEDSILSLDLIEKYNLPKINYTPDIDDSGYIFTLPSGLKLEGLYRCNNSPVEMNMLEGLDGYICIETEKELNHLINLNWIETLHYVKSKHSDFNIDDYL